MPPSDIEPLFTSLDEWATYGIERGWAVRCGHPAWDGKTWVPTLVLQTDEVRALGASCA